MHAVNVKTLAQNRRLRFFPFHILIERSERQHQQLYLYEWKRRIRVFFWSVARILCAERKECVLDDEYISHIHGKQDVCRCAIFHDPLVNFIIVGMSEAALGLSALVCCVCVYRRMGCCVFGAVRCVLLFGRSSEPHKKKCLAHVCMRNGCVR